MGPSAYDQERGSYGTFPVTHVASSAQAQSWHRWRRGHPCSSSLQPTGARWLGLSNRQIPGYRPGVGWTPRAWRRRKASTISGR